ncbi:MAG TPA: ROK family protein [Candidatus Limnocylindrales bacterium]|nr:ROK family protein [Candidatus Limnocylindrales bacterium]
MIDEPPATRHLGLDLGGTNIKWVAVEHAAGAWRVLDRDQVTTPTAEGPDAIVERLATVGAEAVVRNPGVATVGIGIPGLYDPATGATRFLVNIPGAWAGKAVAGPIGAALGLPASLINDARAFGLAELRLGAGRGAASMIGFTLGTGVGGAIAIDGRVLQGHDGTAGEMGHQTIEPDGPWCGCGNRGCLEAFARADQIAAACGTSTAEEAVLRARAGDPRATAGLAQVGRYLGIGIASMVTVITPDRVVIGGGIAAAFDLLVGPIRDELRRRVKTTSLDDVVVVAAELGTWAGAIGAAIHGAEAAAGRDRAASMAVGPAADLGLR